MFRQFLTVKGAREHNLQNIDIEIPRDKLVVITGLSGSGKSSLAFDTIYAEGQRRYVESLSAYARQFLGQMEKPDVDQIDGLSPAIAIQQKTHGRNPRSTVGTVTEIYDYLRLLFARVGTPHCHNCGKEVVSQTSSSIVEQVASLKTGTRLQVLAPLASGRKGEYKKVFDEIRRQGFVRVRIDGEVYELDEVPALDKKKKHDIEIVVDRVVNKPEARKRLADSIETALKLGQGLVMIDQVGKGITMYSEKLSCHDCGLSFDELSPRSFSFNNPHGACPSCTGIGARMEVDPFLCIDEHKTLRQGAIEPWASPNALYLQQMVADVAKAYNFSLDVPFKKLSQESKNIVLNGSGDKKISFRYLKGGTDYSYMGRFEGVVTRLGRLYEETESDSVRESIGSYMRERTCSTCKGARLRPESLAVTVAGKSILETTSMSIGESEAFFSKLKLEASRAKIARDIIKEIRERLGFLVNVGLDYLALDRTAGTLSGGEAQRIHLATQIGSSLMGVLYILDEPSIGLHQRDNARLLDTLMRLRDLGNTVLVVEHDDETMLAADYLVDIGPGAGIHGGKVVAAGTPAAVMANKNSLTGAYLSGRARIEVPGHRRILDGRKIKIVNATLNNLQGIDVDIPLGQLVVVTGVSGSGKSTLVEDTLVPALRHRLLGLRHQPPGYTRVEGTEQVDKVINIDQSPIGRTPRSNAATYTGVFDEVRKLFSSTKESKERGYLPGRFSFNVKGGRCEACQGDGILKIEMHFLPDVYVPCEECEGKRYNRETLEILYKGKTISDVLNMIVSDANVFFDAHAPIKRVLSTLKDVGLDYIKLGQSATTLSGGEAQRVKLSTELAKRSTGKTLYVLDEPTTGLHFHDIKSLLGVLDKLVEGGNTVLIIEHNLDVIKTADWVIDLGPEGGSGGGKIIAQGRPEDIAAEKKSFTGQYLKKVLAVSKPANKEKIRPVRASRKSSNRKKVPA